MRAVRGGLVRYDTVEQCYASRHPPVLCPVPLSFLLLSHLLGGRAGIVSVTFVGGHVVWGGGCAGGVDWMWAGRWGFVVPSARGQET